MTVLPILTLPDPRLRRKGAPVLVVDDALRALAADLAETLEHHGLLGIAAIMVGEPVRLAVLAPDPGAGAATVLVDPRVIAASPERAGETEGCPSVPGTFVEIDRPVSVTVGYRDLDGAERTETARGLRARVIQHEIDLCDGILFIDRLSRLKRTRIEARLAKAARRQR